jgi:hypothetical protein
MLTPSKGFSPAGGPAGSSVVAAGAHAPRISAAAIKIVITKYGVRLVMEISSEIRILDVGVSVRGSRVIN